MKKLRGIVLLLVLLLSSSLVFAIPNPSSEFYVYDKANIMDRQTENYIIQTNDELYKKTGAQIVVAAIDDLEGMDINSYTTALFDKWNIGSSKLDNGLLVLIVPSQGEIRIEVGYGLEGVIPDIRAIQIIEDYIIPSFSEGNFNQGILLGYNEILKYVEEEYDIQLSSRGQITTPELEVSTGEISTTGKMIIIAAIILLIILDFKFFGGWLTYSIIRSLGRGRGGGPGGGGGRRGGGGRSGGGGARGRW